MRSFLCEDFVSQVEGLGLLRRMTPVLKLARVTGLVSFAELLQ